MCKERDEIEIQRRPGDGTSCKSVLEHATMVVGGESKGSGALP